MQGFQERESLVHAACMFIELLHSEPLEGEAMAHKYDELKVMHQMDFSFWHIDDDLPR